MAKAAYDKVQIGVHWVTVILIAAAFGLAWTLEGMSLSPLKLQMIPWHKWVGMTVFGLTALRLLWRAIYGAPGVEASLPAWQRGLATGVHHLLYLVMLALPLSGWLMSSAFDNQVVYLGVLPLPNLIGPDSDLAERLQEVHEALAAILLILIGLHAAGAIKHHLLDRDETLVRMLPILRRKGKTS